MNSKNNKGLTKRELVKEISDMTELKTDVVMSVIDAFITIFIREVIVNEYFHLVNCFTVKSHTRKERKGYNVVEDELVTYPETRILTITLSNKIKYFFRWKVRNENNHKNNVTKDNWQSQFNEHNSKDTSEQEEA